MVEMTVYGGSPQGAAAFYDQAVVRGGHPGAHSRKIFRHDVDAVGFLDFQFRGVPNDGGPFREAGHHRNDRQLIDQRRDQAAFDHTAFQGRTADQKIGGGLSVRYFMGKNSQIRIHHAADA